MTGISEIIASQHEYYLTHTTRDIDFRIENLKKLKDTILRYENKLYESPEKGSRQVFI